MWLFAWRIFYWLTPLVTTGVSYITRQLFNLKILGYPISPLQLPCHRPYNLLDRFPNSYHFPLTFTTSLLKQFPQNPHPMLYVPHTLDQLSPFIDSLNLFQKPRHDTFQHFVLFSRLVLVKLKGDVHRLGRVLQQGLKSLPRLEIAQPWWMLLMTGRDSFQPFTLSMFMLYLSTIVQ